MHAPQASARYIVPGVFPGLLKLGNIDLSRRPVVHNADGSFSTVDSTSFDVGGREVLVPQVVGDRVVSPREALLAFLRTGRNLGTFASPRAANVYAQRLHDEQALEYAAAGRR